MRCIPFYFPMNYNYRSFGIACAQVAKVPQEIISRSKTILTLVKNGIIPVVEPPKLDDRKLLNSDVLNVLMDTNWKTASAEEISNFFKRLT
mmetsp:Transcript_12590/g.14487  ORF Transcript_12590/g.14487 Transcript_12590/m.14487 type:complete len:91 (+) Transcript_12590:2-274(+)